VGAPVAAHGDTHSGTVAEPGLSSSTDGYTLTPTDATLTPGIPEIFAFRVTGPDGAAVTAFDEEHDKRMHLIVVRRDGTGFQHVHPEMAADGTWNVPLTLPAAGSYRAFADFTPANGTGTVLGVDLAAPGPFEPVAHGPSRTAHVDGYTVELSGDLLAGRASPVTLTLTRGGQPVTDLQPYSAPTATSSLCARATSPTCMSTPRVRPATAPPRPDRRSGSSPRRPRPGPFGCFWTSSTPGPCARQSSRDDRTGRRGGARRAHRRAGRPRARPRPRREDPTWASRHRRTRRSPRSSSRSPA
jgi:hypothetical protein